MKQPANKTSTKKNLIPIKANGFTMMASIEDIVNSTYTDVAGLKLDQSEMKEQLLQNAGTLGEINRSIKSIDENMKTYNTNVEIKLQNIARKHEEELGDVRANMPKKWSIWFIEKAKTADAVTKVLKIAIILFIIINTIVYGIPGLFNVLKAMGLKM